MKKLTKLEQMHKDNNTLTTPYALLTKKDTFEPVTSMVSSAEITEQIAIEFAKFCLNKAKDLDTHTVYHRINDIFQEFLKTKQ